LLVANQVVGGEYQQRHVGTDVRLGPQRTQCDRRCRAATEWLEQERGVRRRATRKRRIDVLRREVVVAIGDRQQRSRAG
jgi:hypothetical protein